jgi:hypothetical protein
MDDRLTRADVERLLGITPEFLRVLEEEAVVRVDREGRHLRSDLPRIRVCWNLHHQLGVNFAGLEVALHLLDRLERERRQIRDVLGWLSQRMEEP